MTKFTTPEKGYPWTAEEEERRVKRARRLITRLEGVGQGLGYGVFHGGTLVRDIDVVAVPWQSPTCDEGPSALLSALTHRMGLHWRGSTKTVYGHTAATLWEPAYPDHPIDLKVMGPAVAREVIAPSDMWLVRANKDVGMRSFALFADEHYARDYWRWRTEVGVKEGQRTGWRLDSPELRTDGLYNLEARRLR